MFLSDDKNNESILNFKLSIFNKYHLNKLYEEILKEKNDFDKFKNELIKKYGKVQDNGNFTILNTDPSFKEFNEELESLLTIKKNITIPNFNLDEFLKLEITGNFPIFFKIIDKKMEGN